MIITESELYHIVKLQNIRDRCAENHRYPQDYGCECEVQLSMAIHKHAPALIKAALTARDYGEALDNIREVLGLKETHYLVIHNEVENLKAKNDELRKELALLDKLRGE